MARHAHSLAARIAPDIVGLGGVLVAGAQRVPAPLSR
jgi:hypothetical protein